MMPSNKAQNKIIQEEFTKQAEAYASNPGIIDQDWAFRLVNASQPSEQDRVLEIATGPGYVAFAFATIVKEVVGIDITDAPLAIAEQTRRARRLDNVRFEKCDAYLLPFEDASFDIVVCRLAFHHFSDQKRVLSEMVRTCKPNGKIVVEDIVSSEHHDKAAYYNHWERLRDPSHTSALSISGLIALFTEMNLEVTYLRTEERAQEIEQWMRNSQTPDVRANQIRELISKDEAHGLSGLRVYRVENQLYFNHRYLTVIGEKKYP